MLTIAEYKNAEQVKEYFDEHLSSGEYHSEKGDSIGKWQGLTVNHLGLEEGSVVERDDFHKLVSAINPKTGRSYLIRQKDNRIIAREMLFSAPKTVSILAVTFGDTRLSAAHEKAVSVAFKEMERLAETRVRKGFWVNADGKRKTGNIIGARFTHKTSRALDPQLHTHNVVFNVTYDPVEERLKAMCPHTIYNNASYISEIYRSVLAREVKALGYEIEDGRHTFRIKGVSPEIEALYSKRANQIEKAAAEILEKKGIIVDKRGRALLAELTRRSKNHDISESDYLKFQRSQLTASQIKELQGLIKNSEVKAIEQNIARDPEKTRALTDITINYVIKHVFERASVIEERALIREALKRAKGEVLLADIVTALKDSRFIHRGDFVMTREERQRELRIINQIRTGKSKFSPFITRFTEINKQLSKDQLSAVFEVGECKDQYAFIRGVAGSGKTFALTALHSQISGAKKPLMLAPTGSAAETLRNEGFGNAKTLQYFLSSKFARNEAKNGTLIVDEAGLISTRQMDLLLRITEKNNTRVIFVGDTGQHNSVEGGDALRLLEDYSVIKKAELSEVKRQKDSRYREAVQSLARGEVVKGFEKLEAMDVVHEVKGKKRFDMIADAYLKNEKSGVSTLIVSPTNREIEALNAVVRKKMKEEGLVSSDEVKLKVLKSLNFTTAEKSYAPNYEPGQILSIHKNEGEFKQGETLRVVSVKDGVVESVDRTGKEFKVEPSKHQSLFDVVKENEKLFAKGDKIIVKANFASSPTNRIPNGTIAEIEKIETDGSIKLKNGKVLGEHFRQFDHAYAITSQSSQGKTADQVILSARSGSGMALSKNQFYVSCSRGRNGVQVFTDSKEKLLEAVTRSSARKLVIEHMVRDRIFLKGKAFINREVEKAQVKSREVLDKALAKFKGRTRDRALLVSGEVKKDVRSKDGRDIKSSFEN